LGFKEKNKKDWMTQQTWEKIRERMNIKEAMNACKTQARKVEIQKKVHRKESGSEEKHKKGSKEKD
jgi:hypothetical protein